MRKGLLISLTIICVLSTSVMAGNNPNAKVAIHVRAHSAKLGCNYGTITDCHGIVYTLDEANVDAFPVFFDLVEYRGCEYGVDWPSSWGSAGFTNCADFVIGAVINSGDGASHTWGGDCKSGVMVPAYLWIYPGGAGTICPVGHPYHGFIYTLDCAEGKDEVAPARRACAGMGGTAGDDPCELNPVAPTTWSEIKTLFQ